MIDYDLALFSSGRISVLKFFPQGNPGALAQLASMIVEGLDDKTLEEFIAAMMVQGTWEGPDQVISTIERLKSRERKLPNPTCEKCQGEGWITVFRGGLSGAQRCTCWSVRTQPQITGTVEPPEPLSPEEQEWIQNFKERVALSVPVSKGNVILPLRPLRTQQETDRQVAILQDELRDRA